MGAVAPGLTSEGPARREGGAFRRPVGERGAQYERGGPPGGTWPDLVGTGLGGGAGAAGPAGPQPAAPRPGLRPRRLGGPACPRARRGPGAGPGAQDRALRGPDPGAAGCPRPEGPGPCGALRPARTRGPARRPPPPGHPAGRPVAPPAGRGGLGEDLLALAADAAARAWELAVGRDADAGLGLAADADLARRAGRALGSPAFAALAARSGVDGRDLARQGLAWQHGGAAGLELLHAEWDPLADAAGAADLLKAARAVLGDVSGTPAPATRNRVTAGRLQLRLGRDLLWYPYVRSDGDWEPAGPPKPDPVAAAAEL